MVAFFSVKSIAHQCSNPPNWKHCSLASATYYPSGTGFSWKACFTNPHNMYNNHLLGFSPKYRKDRIISWYTYICVYIYIYKYTVPTPTPRCLLMFILDLSIFTDIHTASIRFQSRFLTAVSAGALLPQFQGSEHSDGIETSDIREGTWA